MAFAAKRLTLSYPCQVCNDHCTYGSSLHCLNTGLKLYHTHAPVPTAVTVNLGQQLNIRCAFSRLCFRVLASWRLLWWL